MWPFVGYGRTPYSRVKPGEPVLTVDEYLAWGWTGPGKIRHVQERLRRPGAGVAHAEAAHTVNWSAAVAESLGISPKVLLRADQGGASAAAMLIRAAGMIRAGIVDRVLVMGATPLSPFHRLPPGLPLSPRNARASVFWDFQGPSA